MLSMLFVLTEKIEYANEHPLLSAKDVRDIIVRNYAQKQDIMQGIPVNATTKKYIIIILNKSW
jgi:hypothetical protein